jgi:hypothetical protein
MNGTLEVVIALLGRGAQADVEGLEGRPTLTVAAFRQSVEIGRVLLDYGANVDGRPEYDQISLLHTVRLQHNLPFAQLLLDVDNEERTALDMWFGEGPFMLPEYMAQGVRIFLSRQDTEVGLKLYDHAVKETLDNTEIWKPMEERYLRTLTAMTNRHVDSTELNGIGSVHTN